MQFLNSKGKKHYLSLVYSIDVLLKIYRWLQFSEFYMISTEKDSLNLKPFVVIRNRMDNSSYDKKSCKLYRSIAIILILSMVLMIAAYYFNSFQQSMAQMNMPSTSMNMNMSAPIDYNSTKFITYKNSSLGIQVLHPVSWKPVEKSTSRGQVVEFIPVVENEHQPLMPFVTLSLEKATDNISNLNSLTNQNLQIAKSMPGFHMINSSDIALSGVPAHKIIYTFNSPVPMPSEFQSMNIWTVKGNTAYTISYSESKSEYLTHIPAIEKMVKSFAIAK